MLNLAIFLPLLTALIVLTLPSSKPALIRWTALAGAAATLIVSTILWLGFDPAGVAMQWRTTVEWVPSIGASYDVGVGGLSLPLITLTALLLTLVMIYVLPMRERVKGHAFLFLLMATGLIGLFAARDLLLFYLFFEIGLVPMYFIIGIWGHEERRYAAIKFFLYTRAGSLAMLLSFLGLYLAMTPHTFSLDAIIVAQPLAGKPVAAGLALLGMLIGFGVKLPTFPLHNWLPDAHVEAPTEGSVMLAGIQLKMGAYGLIAVMLPTLPQAARTYGWWMLALGVVSLIYGALAALAQRDFKRLVAYTSVNHMGYILIAVAVAALAAESSVRQLALNGALLQAISHGLLTGGMFFLAGILQSKTGTREMARFGGLMSKAPLSSALLGVLAFASLGLPGFSGFVAEFQVVGATLSISVWAAVFIVLGLVITTGLYLRILISMVMGEPPEDSPKLSDLSGLELTAVAPLAVLSLVIGVLPFVILPIIENGTRLLAELRF